MTNRLMIKLTDGLYIDLGKARSHKYYTKKPDGKGGWIYYYKLMTYHNDNFLPENLKRINHFIENIRNEKIEYSQTYDNKGNLLLFKKGNEKEIIYTPDELKKIKNSNVLVHNHPSGNSFSLADFGIFMKYNVNEIRVCCIDENIKTNYSLKHKKEIPEDKQAEIYFFYKNLVDEKNYNLSIEFHEGYKTAIEANKNFNHPLILKIINKYGEYFEYKKF